MKINASALRQGNVIDVDGKLFAVLTAENIKPGKGTPVTQLELRRLSDGVKITERYRTTEAVERAYIEDGTYQYLFAEDSSFAFMETETFNQISVPKAIVGDQAVYLQDGMQVTMRVHQGTPVAIQLPARVTLEVVETEPVVKRQTAQASHKPALLSNGMRTTVPPHITPGTRIVVSTADGSYQERAKD